MRKIIAILLLLGMVSPIPISKARAAGEGMKTERGLAAVYAQKLVGNRTTSGERLDREHLTAAHRSLPFGTIIEVINPENGRKALVCINDRGPHRRRILLDLSPAAAAALGINRRATASVEFRVAEAP
jgi:rare lipoprotein A